MRMVVLVWANYCHLRLRFAIRRFQHGAENKQAVVAWYRKTAKAIEYAEGRVAR